MDKDDYSFNDDGEDIQEDIISPEVGDDLGLQEKDDESGVEDLEEGDIAGTSRLTASDVWFDKAYDTIQTAIRKNKDGAINDIVTTIILANPKHNSGTTANFIRLQLLNKQGHHRMVNTVYVPETPLRGEDMELDLIKEDDSGFNKEFTEAAKEQITRFVDYLATRDLSKDSLTSKHRKQQQLPALIILLFSTNLYDLILNCPTMPEEYDVQINAAMKTISKSKYDIVEELAKKYDEMGRTKVAAMVRKMQLAWFIKEPAALATSAEFSDLELTPEDIAVFKEYRAKFSNTSTSITQEVISDLIEVVVDKEAGTTRKLKDKTRAKAIVDIKKTFAEWSKSNKTESELAQKIIWKKL